MNGHHPDVLILDDLCPPGQAYLIPSRLQELTRQWDLFLIDAQDRQRERADRERRAYWRSTLLNGPSTASRWRRDDLYEAVILGYGAFTARSRTARLIDIQNT